MNATKSEIINGVTFYYDPMHVNMDDNLLSELTTFAQQADDEVYTVYYDEEALVIY